jgi:hypothetical protein
MCDEQTILEFHSIATSTHFQLCFTKIFRTLENDVFSDHLMCLIRESAKLRYISGCRCKLNTNLDLFVLPTFSYRLLERPHKLLLSLVPSVGAVNKQCCNRPFLAIERANELTVVVRQKAKFSKRSE